MLAENTRGIRRRGNSFHVDVSFKGRRLTGTCKTFEAALQKRAEFQHRLFTGAGVVDALKSRRKNWTVGEAAEYTCRVAWARAASRGKMEYYAKEAVEFFGGSRPLNTLNTQEIDRWVFHLEQRRLADGSINHRLSALSRMMSVAMDRGGLDAKPRIPRKRLFETRFRIVSVKEEITLLQFMHQMGFDHQADAVEVLIDTGLRVGELFRVRESDIDLNENLLHVWQTKTRAPRAVKMTRRVREVLKRHTLGHPTRRVFPFRHHHLYVPWERAKARMGLMEDSHFTPLALRHTCASRLVQRGVNLKVVQTWMGHKAYQSTMRYAHLVPDSLDDARLALESFGSRRL